jgi:hypothetical protein
MTDRSNGPAPWVEVSALGGGLIVAMLFAMWARQPPAGCARLPEAPRRVELSSDMDREHLSNDLASADRIARRYAAASSRADDQQTLFLECQDTLLQQIASTHGVSLGQLNDSAE